jgi:hypothetical protein
MPNGGFLARKVVWRRLMGVNMQKRPIWGPLKTNRAKSRTASLSAIVPLISKLLDQALRLLCKRIVRVTKYEQLERLRRSTFAGELEFLRNSDFWVARARRRSGRSGCNQIRGFRHRGLSRSICRTGISPKQDRRNRQQHTRRRTRNSAVCLLKGSAIRHEKPGGSIGCRGGSCTI